MVMFSVIQVFACTLSMWFHHLLCPCSNKPNLITPSASSVLIEKNPVRLLRPLQNTTNEERLPIMRPDKQ